MNLHLVFSKRYIGKQCLTTKNQESGEKFVQTDPWKHSKDLSDLFDSSIKILEQCEKFVQNDPWKHSKDLSDLCQSAIKMLEQCKKFVQS